MTEPPPFVFGEGCEGNTRREKEAGGNTVNQRRGNGGRADKEEAGEEEEEEVEGQIRTERKRAKSLFKMLKSEMSHTPCPPFVPLGLLLVQHASDGSVGRLGKTRGVCPCLPPTKTARGATRSSSWDGRMDGRSKKASHVRRLSGKDEKKNRKQTKQKRTRTSYTMTGGGRNSELMKVKASGGETLHAAAGATFSSVASTSCQETQLIGLEKLGVGGVQGRQGGCGIWRNSAADAF